MTTYLIAGDGDMPKRELHRTLGTLAEDDSSFGLALLAREETALDAKVADFTFDGELEEWPANEVSSILEEFGDDTPAALLACFVNPRDEDAADDYLTDLIRIFHDAGFAAYAVNDGMAELSAVEAEIAEEAAVALETEVDAIEEAIEEDEGDADIALYDRAELELLKIKELRALASALGLEVSSRQRDDFVEAILEAQGNADEAIEPTVYDHDEVEEFNEAMDETGQATLVGMNGTAMAVIHLRDRFIAITLTREQVEHFIEVGEVL